MTILRGVELVEQAIGKLANPRPLSREQVAALTLVGGRPLPPSLARWLEYDAGWVELFADPARPTLQPQLLTDFMGSGFEPLLTMIPGPCYPLRPSHGDTSCRFLYAGVADELGEYPIFVADMDDWYLVALEAPGFDVYVAEAMGVLKRPLTDPLARASWFDDPELGPAMRAQGIANFRGYGMCEIFGTATLLDGGAGSWQDEEPDEISVFRSGPG